MPGAMAAFKAIEAILFQSQPTALLNEVSTHDRGLHRNSFAFVSVIMIFLRMVFTLVIVHDTGNNWEG